MKRQYSQSIGRDNELLKSVKKFKMELPYKKETVCIPDTIDYHIQSHVPSMGYFLLSCWTVGNHRSLPKTIAIVLAYPPEPDDGTLLLKTPGTLLLKTLCT